MVTSVARHASSLLTVPSIPGRQEEAGILLSPSLLDYSILSEGFPVWLFAMEDLLVLLLWMLGYASKLVFWVAM